MRKIMRLLIAMIIVVISIVPINAGAVDEKMPMWQDVYLTAVELDEILPDSDVVERATFLIASYALGIKKEGNKLIIAGTTTGVSTVVKCGFKEVVIQRRANSTQEWQDYVTYEDLYDDDFSYLLSKSLTVATGYQYRATAIHYAKKNIFSTEKINNTSNTVVFA